MNSNEFYRIQNFIHGEWVEERDVEYFNKVLLGYGQFGVITEATLKMRKFSPISLHYVYYSTLTEAIEDMQVLVREDAADYVGILTILDKAINLLVAFDSEERERKFFSTWRKRIRGYGEAGFTLRTAAHYLFRPWKFREALYLLERKRSLLPDLKPATHVDDGKRHCDGRHIWTGSDRNLPLCSG